MLQHLNLAGMSLGLDAVKQIALTLWQIGNNPKVHLCCVHLARNNLEGHEIEEVVKHDLQIDQSL